MSVSGALVYDGDDLVNSLHNACFKFRIGQYGSYLLVYLHT